MATANQRDMVRFDLAFADDALDDTLLDALYARVAGVEFGYADDGTMASEAQVRLLIIGNLLSSAAKRNDHRQNQSEEKASQIHAQLLKERERWQKALDVVIAGGLSEVMFGALRKVNPRLIELPDTTPYMDTGNDVSRIGEGSDW